MEREATRLEQAHREWEGACSRITTDNELFDRFIDASIRDLHALMMPVQGGALPAAGIPWYVAPFGRDSLLAACESLMINPEVARGTLMALAWLQARDDEPWRDAEPGRYCMSCGLVSSPEREHIPHTPYYGTVDATPLFLMLAGGYYRWTLDIETLTRCARRWTRRSSGSTSGAIAMATGSLSTSAARPRGSSTRVEGLPRRDRAC